MSRFVRKAHRATALVAGVVGAVLVAGVAPAMAAPDRSAEWPPWSTRSFVREDSCCA